MVLATLVASATIGACTGEIGGDSGTGPGPTTQGFEPAAPQMRRLLARQYLNSIGDLLGPEARAAAEAPADQPLNGFVAIGASQLAVGDAAVIDYEKSARAAAAAAVAEKTRISEYLTCTPSGADDAACLDSYVRDLGRLLFRRALSDEEATAYVDVGLAAGAAYGSFDSALEYATATMLESPNFVYQVELGQPVAGSTLRRLEGGELASRLSFFLLDSTPSRDLLDAAEAGELDTPEGLRAAAADLIESEGARGAVRALFDEVLGLEDLATATKSAALYPAYSPEVAALMREETQRLVEEVAFGGSFDQLLTADHTWANPALAAFYGYPAPASGDWEKVAYPADQPRSGVLGQGGFLATHAHIELTSPTLRGKFIRERLLCQSINPPPNNVSTMFPDDPDAKTMRDKLTLHAVPGCKECHALTDPIGLGFENLDSVGQYRTTENGVEIDPSGDFDDAGHFADGGELGALIAGQPAFTDCTVRNVYRSTLGHIESNGEDPVIEELVTKFDAGGRRLPDLFVELVASDAFRFVGAVQ